MSILSTEMTQNLESAIPKKGRAKSSVSRHKAPPSAASSKKPSRSVESRSVESRPAGVSGTKKPPKADEREAEGFAPPKKERRSPKGEVTQAPAAILSPEANERVAERTTKQERMLTLLDRPDGATIEEMMQATGWQQHSVRGFLAGTLKKKLGFSLASSKPGDGARRYRIEARRGR